MKGKITPAREVSIEPRKKYKIYLNRNQPWSLTKMCYFLQPDIRCKYEQY